MTRSRIPTTKAKSNPKAGKTKVSSSSASDITCPSGARTLKAKAKRAKIGHSRAGDQLQDDVAGTSFSTKIPGAQFLRTSDANPQPSRKPGSAPKNHPQDIGRTLPKSCLIKRAMGKNAHTPRTSAFDVTGVPELFVMHTAQTPNDQVSENQSCEPNTKTQMSDVPSPVNLRNGKPGPPSRSSSQSTSRSGTKILATTNRAAVYLSATETEPGLSIAGTFPESPVDITVPNSHGVKRISALVSSPTSIQDVHTTTRGSVKQLALSDKSRLLNNHERATVPSHTPFKYLGGFSELSRAKSLLPRKRVFREGDKDVSSNKRRDLSYAYPKDTLVDQSAATFTTRCVSNKSSSIVI